jgi:hypothetical protein
MPAQVVDFCIALMVHPDKNAYRLFLRRLKGCKKPPRVCSLANIFKKALADTHIEAIRSVESKELLENSG